MYYHSILIFYQYTPSRMYATQECMRSRAIISYDASPSYYRGEDKNYFLLECLMLCL